MGWPAGLKLNNNLDKFLGELFLWLISLWTSTTAGKACIFIEGVLVMGIPFTLQLVNVLGLIGIGGLSLLSSVLSDMMTLLTMHLTLFYMLSSRIYYQQVRTLLSLFHLFRGILSIHPSYPLLCREKV